MSKRYNLLVADDEYWIREKFRTIIDWTEYNINFLQPACDGEEVLNRVETEGCNILITDVNMPYLNGVELIKIIKDKYPNIVVFVVSGYDDFHFVKESLVAGAINYLLKPINKIDLVSVVSKALEIIANEENNRIQLLKASSALKDRELSVLIKKEPSVFPTSIITDNTMESSGCCVMLIKIHQLHDLIEETGNDINLLSYTVKKYLRDLTHSDDLQVFNYTYRHNEFIIVSEADYDELKRLSRNIAEGLEKKANSTITVAISEHSYSIDTLKDAYLQAVSVMMTRAFNKESCVLFSSKEQDAIHKLMGNIINTEQEKQLKYLFQIKDTSSIKQLIYEDIGVAHIEDSGWNYFEVKQVVRKICNILVESAIEVTTNEEIDEFYELSDYIENCVEKLDAGVICSAIQTLLDDIFNNQPENYDGSIKETVKKAVKYIDEYYSDEITLSGIASMFNVESTYFSKIFKQETGINMIQYLALKRIEKAKEYLKNAKIKNNEVAFLVGYDDYTYFNRVFKKIVGKSPREYRKQYE